MDNNTKARRNYIYNLIYQIFLLIVPLITMPYLSRVLGEAGIGQYSFTYSIAQYFTLLGSLGFTIYAQRKIARHQGDKHLQSVIFWEMFLSRLVSVGLSLSIYVILLFCNVYSDAYLILMKIMSINVVAVAFDVTFFFQGNEKFSTIVIRDTIIKIIGVVLIFVFVKTSDDLWIYVLCLSVILLGSNLSLWPKLLRQLDKVSIKEINCKRHLLPSLKLFIPTVAVSVYTILDKTLIGLMVPGTTTIIQDGVEVIKKVSDIENGFYEQSEKIVKLAMVVVTSLGTVMIPRNSQAVASGDMETFKKNINGAFKFTFMLGTPIMFGLAAIAMNFSPVFFGNGFEKVPYLMMILAPLILIIGMSNILGIQYLLPLKSDNKYTIAIICGAIANVILNLILIPYLYSYGAAIGTIVAESVVSILMFIFARNDIHIKTILKDSYKYLICGAVMFGIVFTIQWFAPVKVWVTIVCIVAGVISYFGMLLLIKDQTLIGFFKNIKEKFKKSSKENK